MIESLSFFRGEGYFSKGRIDAADGSREDEGSRWKGISHHASSFPRVRARTPNLFVFFCLHLRVFVHAFVFHACIFTYMLDQSLLSHARFHVCTCVCVCVPTRTRFSADEPAATETRATIFEPGKERSRMNFLHNFGSPPRGF